MHKDHVKPEGVVRMSEAGHLMARNGIFELPVSNLNIDRVTLPCGGGGYFRFRPFSFFKWGGQTRSCVPRAVTSFYFHPWELDCLNPRIKNIGITKRFRRKRLIPPVQVSPEPCNTSTPAILRRVLPVARPVVREKCMRRFRVNNYIHTPAGAQPTHTPVTQVHRPFSAHLLTIPVSMIY